MPERVQLRRTKGWRKPEGAVVVARPSRWGNPWAAGDPGILHLDGMPWLLAGTITQKQAVRAYYGLLRGYWIEHLPLPPSNWPAHKAEHIAALRRVRNDILNHVRSDLRGRDLCCWCRLDSPCHADVLLELANGTAAP